MKILLALQNGEAAQIVHLLSKTINWKILNFLFGRAEGELGPPEEELTREMPPLRKIDQYMLPDCPCCNISKRYTMSILASVGEFTIYLYLHIL